MVPSANYSNDFLKCGELLFLKYYEELGQFSGHGATKAYKTIFSYKLEVDVHDARIF